MGLEGLGKVLIGGAVVLLVLGGLFLLLGRLGMDRLPGDLVFRRGNATFYFPDRAHDPASPSWARSSSTSSSAARVLVSELDYELPEDLIAQRPAEPRDASRLMVVDVQSGTISHHTFRDLPQFLLPGDALVLNETKVIPARIEARKPTGGGVELLFLRDLGPDRGGSWEVLARPSKRLRARARRSPLAASG